MWIRESSWAMLVLLILHLFGMAFMAGGGALIAGRAVGLARGIEPVRFACFVPVMRGGFALTLFSGLLLLTAYPAKALTNPLFYVKLALLLGATLLTRLLLLRFDKPAEDPYAAPRGSRPVGVIILIMWIGVIAAGGLLRYTHTILLALDNIQPRPGYQRAVETGGPHTIGARR